MTNPTSNFNWQMPTATDLVTDLPADFEVFGQAVDTSMADLRGGTTGQILSKTTNADMDFTWIANDQGDITNIAVTSPITGGGSTGSVTIGIDAATTSVVGAVQLSDSTSTTSSVLASTPTATKAAYDLAAAAVPKSTVTTAGDVIYATGSSAVTRLGIGSAGQVLTVAAGVPSWAAASSGSMTSIASGSLPTGSGTLSLTSISGAYTHLQFHCIAWNGSGNNTVITRLNGDTGANYAYVNEGFTTGSIRTQGLINQTSINLTAGDSAVSGNNKNITVINIPFYTNATTGKVMDTMTGFLDATSARALCSTNGYYYGANAAVTQLDFIYGSNWAGGTYVLYGVK